MGLIILAFIVDIREEKSNPQIHVDAIVQFAVSTCHPQLLNVGFNMLSELNVRLDVV